LREASRALFNLRQRNRRVMDYAIEFCTLAADSGWNEVAISDAFVSGLNEEIKDHLAPMELPALIDSGADESLMDKALASSLGISLEPLQSPVSARGPRSTGEPIPNPSDYPDISKVPPCYHDLKEVFNKAKATSLPPHREWDCAIDLLPGAPIPKARLYSISGPERKAMEEYIEASLRSGIIRPIIITSWSRVLLLCWIEKDVQRASHGETTPEGCPVATATGCMYRKRCAVGLSIGLIPCCSHAILGSREWFLWFSKDSGGRLSQRMWLSTSKLALSVPGVGVHSSSQPFGRSFVSSSVPPSAYPPVITRSPMARQSG
ncbi:hypothetical protein L3Q82_017896, partial [Scortum barcoo]